MKLHDNIYTIIKEIKTDYADTKLLLMGASNNIGATQTFIDSGVNGYFDLHYVEKLPGLAEILVNIKIEIQVIMAAPQNIKYFR